MSDGRRDPHAVAQLARSTRSSVRDFVPVLVEHEALELLREGMRSTAD